MDALSIFIPDHHPQFMKLYHEISTGKLEARTPLLLRRLAALALVRSILVAREWGVRDQIQEIVISHHPSGQPYVTLNSKTPQNLTEFPCLSLSHSGTWVGCALSNDVQPVGIDLEDYNHLVPRPYMDLADYSFSPSEIDFVKQYGEEGFYRLWTAKEAIAKCEGQGMDRALSLDLGEQFLAVFGSLKKTNEEVPFILTVPLCNVLCSQTESYLIRQSNLGKKIMFTVASPSSGIS